MTAPFPHHPAMRSDFAQALMDAATDAVIVIDHRGTIEAVNAAARQLFGYTAAELVGRNVNLLIPADDREHHDTFIARYLETGVSQVIGRSREVEALRRNGDVFPAGISVGQISGTDPSLFVGFLRDLTEYRQTLTALQTERDRARARETEAHRLQARLLSVSRMATMGEMAAGIAHEINQPLTAISNYARACERFAGRQPPAMADLQDCMNEIANETQRAASIIRELRDMARPRTEERELRDLNDVVRQTRHLILADARAHGTAVSFEIAAGLPLVSIEVVQIQQLLLNLVLNALEAVDVRGDGQREIRITTGLNVEGDVELSVTDNGRGVDPGVQQDMFEPFVSTKPSGTGLGLAISRTIAQNHGGQLLLLPVEGSGACFTLRLTPPSPVPAP